MHLRYKPRLRSGTNVSSWKPVPESKNRGLVENKQSSLYSYNRICISLIDETTDTGQAAYNSNYNTFRSLWPDRPLWVFKPMPPEGGREGNAFFIPANWNTSINDHGPIEIDKDFGNPALATDLFTVVGLDSLPATAKVGLFIDNSGSLTTAKVQATYDLFVQKVTSAGIGIITVTNGFEDYITPFITMNE